MSNLKLGVIGYVPPLKFQDGLSAAFLQNLNKYPATHETVLFTDPQKGDAIKFKNMVELKVSIDEFARGIKANDQKAKYVANNAVFITAMKMAKKQGFTHVIYLEADCRFGETGWDAVIFEEFFSHPTPLVCAGSLVCWNPHAGGLEALQRWEDLIHRNNKNHQSPNSAERNFPIPTYGMGQARNDKVSVFPNGALGVYDLTWLDTLFGGLENQNTVNFSKLHAWDFVLGERIWETFGPDSFNVVAHLQSIYSSYGDVITTEEQRLEMLRSKRCCAVHQVKTGAQP